MSTSSLKCYLFNARSLLANLHDFQLFLECQRPDVVVIVESWLKQEVPDSVLVHKLPYTVYRRDRGSNGGGLVIIVKDCIPSARVRFASKGAEICTVRVFSPLTGTSVRFIGAYRPPSYVIEQNDAFFEAITTLMATDEPTVLCGDFNLPGIEWKDGRPSVWHSSARPLVELALSADLRQHVVSATRAYSILDLVFSNEPDLQLSAEVIPGIGRSDHAAIHFSLDFEQPKACEQGNPIPLFKECCVSSLNEYFLSYDWRQDFAEKNASEMYDSFVSVVNSSISEFCCFSSGKKSPGKVPDHILRLQRRQALLWKTRFSPGAAQLLKACSAELKRVTDKYARNVQKRLLVGRSKRELYSYVSCRITDKRRRKPPVDEHGDAIVHDKAQADAFAAHFAAVFNSTVPEESLLPEIGQPRSRIAYCYFTTDEVMRRLSALQAKLNVTADKISSKMLKLCAESLSLPLCLIFNASMESGIVPELFKEAYVVPVHKKDPPLISNFRPVSVTSVVCRTMERIVRDRLIAHLEENDLLPANQFGFRAKHSVVDALLGSHDDWTQALEEGHHVDCVFVDFSSAFDKLNFVLLMHKLKSLGVESYLLQWINNFLRNRKCMVRIGNTFSEPYSPSSGTPQGSALGPLLFIVYTSDLLRRLNGTCTIVAYADDIKLYKVYRPSESTDALQQALDVTEEWSVENDLPLNPIKCIVLHMGKGNVKRDYRIGEVVLSASSMVRDLGYNVSSDLSPNAQVEKVCKSANGRLFAMLKIIKCNDFQVLTKAYTTYVRPLLESTSALFNGCNKTLARQLEAVQKTFSRAAVQRSRPHDAVPPYTERCRLLKLRTLEQRRFLLDLRLSKKILLNHCSAPNRFVSRPCRTRYGPNRVFVHSYRLALRRQSFYPRMSSLLSKLPYSAVYESSLSAFTSFINGLDISSVTDLCF